MRFPSIHFHRKKLINRKLSKIDTPECTNGCVSNESIAGIMKHLIKQPGNGACVCANVCVCVSVHLCMCLSVRMLSPCVFSKERICGEKKAELLTCLKIIKLAN